MKSWLSILLRTIFGLALLFYLIFFVAEPSRIFEILKSSSLPLVALALSLNIVGLVVSALRWKLLLDEQGKSFSVKFLLGSYLVGTFFNHFLPTRFGGDLLRMNDTRSVPGGRAGAAGVVAAERMSGILALLVFALIAALARISFVSAIPVIWVALAVSLAGILAVTALWLMIPPGFFAARRPASALLQKVFRQIDSFHLTIQNLMAKKNVLTKLMLGAFILQLNVVTHYFVVGRAIGLASIPFFDYFFIILILTFVLSVPVSINGIGVRDLTMLQMMAVYSYSPAHAITFSFLDFSLNLLLGLVGGLVYLFRKK